MSKYKYSARNKEGALIKGVLEGRNREYVVDALQAKNLIVVDVREDLGFNLSALSEINIGGIPLKDKVVFMRQFATMISASLPLTQSLQILRDQATNPHFKKVLAQVLADVEGGISLSKAFKRNDSIFDDITISMISAGEESGQLEMVMRRLALEIEKSNKLKEKIKSAFIYPVIISIVVLIVLILLMTVLVPAMKDIYSDAGAVLPLPTQILISASDFLLGYWWAILLVIAVIGIGIKLYSSSDSGKVFFAKLVLKVPIMGRLIIMMQIAQFTRTLALLLKSGLSIIEALRLTSDAMSNLLFKQAVLTAKDEVEKGTPLSLPLARSEVFPIIISQMVSVGEETGKLDVVLKKMAAFYDDEVEVMSANLSTLLEPLILVVMGSLIAFIAAAVYMPMFNLSTAMG
jgi:type IV pilus assembly protein PilC